jgi:selenoprotein W-related protein
LNHFKREITGLNLVPSDGGRFEVSLNGKLLYSKLEEGRFPAEIEILELVRESRA